MGVAASKKRRTVVVKQDGSQETSTQTSISNKERDYPSEPPPTYEESEEISVSYNLQPNEPPVPYSPHTAPLQPIILNEPSCSHYGGPVGGPGVNGNGMTSLPVTSLAQSLATPVIRYPVTNDADQTSHHQHSSSPKGVDRFFRFMARLSEALGNNSSSSTSRPTAHHNRHQHHHRQQQQRRRRRQQQQRRRRRRRAIGKSPNHPGNSSVLLESLS